ncbi:putative phosphatase regulatory subunit-domain-containing protein [Ilyonectria robusta]|uniref:putative phosphatase regulatory subunit-domain-containing protein n=1 Tax=Ilyonectria robusta TaxID=1079257 RepID=UPI001E8D4048|nr:putative phosphatase regulatory subunit-domain-containing protein [Ilyonectria robusta]KAH8650803.1 putative phosphatase regulatory subunit-domain-containing protein [Ilyonectria robusta]
MPYTRPLKPSPCSPSSETVHLDVPWSLPTKPRQSENQSAKNLPQALRDSRTHESSLTPPPSDIVADLRASCDAPHKSDDAVLTESEDETEDWRQSKQRVVRKMSGELVRPILRPPPSRRRPASMPTSPTATKSVHFHSHRDSQFFSIGCPLSISAGSRSGQVDKSSRERPMSRQDAAGQWEMVTPNFPRQSGSRESQFVYIKKLRLLDDQNSMQGLVAVRNVAFQKSVTCRFTFDNWKTTSNVAAAYSDGNASGEAPSGYDFFVFTIELSDIVNLESKIAHLSVRYAVNGQEYWDNNSGRNFQVCFFKKTLPRDDNVLVQVVPLQSRNGVPNNVTVVKPTSSPFRGLDLAKCYSISASLNATVRAAKRKASRNDSAGSMNATVGSLKLSSRSFAQKSTKSGISAGCSESKFTISMRSGSDRYCSQRALTAHTLLGDIDMYDNLNTIPFRPYGLC